MRSALYMPGSNERALIKAQDLQADALIFDLEDSVAPDAKQQARARVSEAASSTAYAGRTVAIRINAIGTEWYDEDVKAVAASGPDAVVLAKVQSSDQVLQTQHSLEQAGAPDRIRIWAMLETPIAVLQSFSIAHCTPRLSTLVMGTNDLLKDLHGEAVPGRRPLLTSLSLSLLAARAAGKDILDAVYNDVGDLQGFERECLDGRELGFDGKSLIHPGQIEIANMVFSPSTADIQHAKRVIDAFERASLAGDGVTTLDGRMIESLHVQSARRILALGPNALQD